MSDHPDPEEGRSFSNREIDWGSLDKKRYLGYGFIGFLLARTVTFPVSLIKTRLQYQRAHSTQYSGGFHAFKQIIKQESLRGLFKGYIPLTMGTIPTHLLYVTTLDYLRYQISKNSTWLAGDSVYTQAIRSSLAASAASVVSLAVVVPFDVISQQLMIQDGVVQKQRFNGTLSTIRGIVRQEGYRGFYRGLSATMLVFVPNSGIWWLTYSLCKGSANEALDYIHSVYNWEKNISLSKDILVEVFSGCFAGIMGVLITNPVDVAKTRIQVLHPTQPGAQKLFHVMKQLYHEGGLKAFSRGLSPRLFNAVQVSIGLVVVYEQVKRLSKIPNKDTKIT